MSWYSEWTTVSAVVFWSFHSVEMDDCLCSRFLDLSGERDTISRGELLSLAEGSAMSSMSGTSVTPFSRVNSLRLVELSSPIEGELNGESAVPNKILLIGWVLTSVLRTGRYYSPCLPPVTAQCVLKSLGISITPTTSDSSTTTTATTTTTTTTTTTASLSRHTDIRKYLI